MMTMGIVLPLKYLPAILGVSDRVLFIGPLHGQEKWELLASAQVLDLTVLLGKFWKCGS